MNNQKIKNTEVLFINPPFYRFINQVCEVFPLGLGYLVACLKQESIDSLIYNADYTNQTKDKQFVQVLNKTKAG